MRFAQQQERGEEQSESVSLQPRKQQKNTCSEMRQTGGAQLLHRPSGHGRCPLLQSFLPTYDGSNGGAAFRFAMRFHAEDCRVVEQMNHTREKAIESSEIVDVTKEDRTDRRMGR